MEYFDQTRICPYCNQRMDARVYPVEKVWGGLCGHCSKIVSCQPLDTGITRQRKEKK